MKTWKKYFVSVMVGLLLLQTIMIDVSAMEKEYDVGVPMPIATPTPTMPLAVMVEGSIQTDVECSQEAEKIVLAGFSIRGGFGAKTDEKGFFRMSAPYYPYEMNITIEKPGFLKRTLIGININRQVTSLLDIPMWAGDVNGDSTINMVDIMDLASKFNSIKGDSLYLSDMDLNKDDTINMQDIMTSARHFNATSQSYPAYIQVFPTPTGMTSPTPSTPVTSTPGASATPVPTATSTPTPNSGLEIERKFLIDVNKIPYNLGRWDKYELTQAYISFSPEIRIRNVSDVMYFLTVKAPVDQRGMIREEREFWITKAEYEALFKKIEGNVIYKDRYQAEENGFILAIDIFKEGLEGLAFLEIEFASEEEANKYIPADWVGPDVTSDKRYKNGNLARYGLPTSQP